MIGSIAFVLLGAAAAATPCENLANLKLQNATITSAKQSEKLRRTRTRSILPAETGIDMSNSFLKTEI